MTRGEKLSGLYLTIASVFVDAVNAISCDSSLDLWHKNLVTLVRRN